VRALVTGAGGFIGAHVAAALAADGWDVRGLDRDVRFVPEGVEPVAGDVTSPGDVGAALAGCDALFHLAAVYSFARRAAARMEAVNVRGTRIVLDAAARAGVRVVHTSSCGTCGPVPGRPATEEDAPPAYELDVPYKRTKIAGERIALAAAAEGADVVVVNPTTPVGPGDRRPTPTGRMVADVASGRARAYLAGGALNVVDVRDVAASHLRAFEHGRAGRRYLLGGEDLELRDVFAHVARAAGRPVPRVALPWAAVYGAARVADAALRPLGRAPRLLDLDEVRLARLPMRFDDARARAELGHLSRPASEALAVAARAALDRSPEPGREPYPQIAR
jgi:dihydroflavonol-4-reductase